MSILSSTLGTPDRVWALVALLRENDGTLNRAEAADWLNPGFRKDDQTVAEKPVAFQQVLGAATSLGAVEAIGNELHLNPDLSASSYAVFADWVYDRLIQLAPEEKDAVLLELLAWVGCESAKRNNVSWLLEYNNAEFADAAEASLPPGADDDGDRRINTVKLPYWRRWLVFLGLTEEIKANPPYQVDISRRLTREIARLELERNVPIAAEAFFQALRQRMPFVDGGWMYSDAARRIGFALDPNQLSPILSQALRDLHDDGTIELEVLGDMTANIRLAPDPAHKIGSFYAVSIKEGDAR